MRQASIPHNVDLIGEIKHTLCVKTNWVLLSSRYFNLRVLVQQVLSSNPALPSLAVPVYFCRQSGTVSEVAVWVRYPLSYHHILRSGFVLCASLECRRSDKGELSPKCGPLSTHVVIEGLSIWCSNFSLGRETNFASQSRWWFRNTTTNRQMGRWAPITRPIHRQPMSLAPTEPTQDLE